MQNRNRPKVSMTLEPELVQSIDALAEQLGHSRSRVLEDIIKDGVLQHKMVSGAKSELSDGIEMYRRVYLSPSGATLGGLGIRGTVYDLRWDELPTELQGHFPPNCTFSKWEGSAKELPNEAVNLEAQAKEIRRRLAAVKSESAKTAEKGKKR